MSDHTVDSDNSNLSIKNGRNINLLGGNSDSASLWQDGDSDRKCICQNPWVNLEEGG